MKGKIFNAQEMQAIIAGNKTMFREVIKPKINPENYSLPDKCGMELLLSECPYQVGQKIFVKESFAEVEVGAGMGYNTGKAIIRRADDDYDVKWKPAQHMKQEQSRLTLQIKEIRVERLQEISDEDAIAEGITSRPSCSGFADRYDGYSMDWSQVGKSSKWCPSGTLTEADICLGSPQMAFANFWNTTHKKPEEKFGANPWVWSIQFEVVK